MSSKTRKHPPAKSSHHESPVPADGLFKEALRLHQQGNLPEAERLYRQVLEHNAKHPDSLHLLGMIGYQCGHSAPAAELISQAIAAKPDEALYHSNLGVVMNSLGKLDQAIASYQRAVALKPAYPEAHSNLANVLVAQGKYSDAIVHFQQALALNPNNPDTNANFGVAFAEQGDMAQAIPYYERAIALKPEFPEALSNLGNALRALGRLEEAIACYHRALALKPDYLTALYNLGNTYQGQDKFAEAFNAYDRALAIQHNYLEAAYGKALAQLLDGDFADGWQNYECRWKTHGHAPMRPYSYPRWKGNRLTSGNLLIWGEQGIGDEIMFAGLIPDVLKTGNRCILDCDARLVPLFTRSFPDVQVVTGLDATHEKDASIAAQLPSGSLPRLFRATEGAFAATTSPYLMAEQTRRNQFRSRYAWGKRVVGLAWYTKNVKTGRSRCIDLAQLTPLLQTSDVFFVSLQYGDHADLEKQASAAQAPLFIDREVDQLTDIDLFAAQIAAMDLVITIDNCTAHLAGALGVPVWVMLPFDRDWRWMQAREDSPWYPTMRLFRQPRLGDWQSVVDAVNAALQREAQPLGLC